MKNREAENYYRYGANQKLYLPQEMQYRFIAIEGNIGVGKSTLANLLAQHYNARTILEEFADNTFLPKFYREKERYAFPLELSFLADRYKQMKRVLLQQELFHENIISDYTFVKSKLFARINLPPDEYDLFQNLYEIAEASLPKPDLLIYLHSPIERLQHNIKNRAREYEQGISDSYLEDVAEIYQEYLKLNLQKTLYIDTSNLDFMGNDNHFNRLISFIEDEREFDTYYLDIS
jgi:deoxyadenosine/deoxycytidine kinase